MAKVTVDLPEHDLNWFEGVAYGGGVSLAALLSSLLSTCARDNRRVAVLHRERHDFRVVHGDGT